MLTEYFFQKIFSFLYSINFISLISLYIILRSRFSEDALITVIIFSLRFFFFTFLSIYNLESSEFHFITY